MGVHVGVEPSQSTASWLWIKCANVSWNEMEKQAWKRGSKRHGKHRVWIMSRKDRWSLTSGGYPMSSFSAHLGRQLDVDLSLDTSEDKGPQQIVRCLKRYRISFTRLGVMHIMWFQTKPQCLILKGPDSTQDAMHQITNRCACRDLEWDGDPK